jgi:hypothetical protein
MSQNSLGKRPHVADMREVGRHGGLREADSIENGMRSAPRATGRPSHELQLKSASNAVQKSKTEAEIKGFHLQNQRRKASSVLKSNKSSSLFDVCDRRPPKAKVRGSNPLGCASKLPMNVGVSAHPSSGASVGTCRTRRVNNRRVWGKSGSRY